MEVRLACMGGTTRTMIVHTALVDHRILIHFSDITDIRRAQGEVLRLSRARKAVTECNQALVRATDEEALLRRVCQIICDIGGYRMAWVGQAGDDAEQSLAPLCWGGHEDGFFLRPPDLLGGQRERPLSIGQ